MLFSLKGGVEAVDGRLAAVVWLESSLLVCNRIKAPGKTVKELAYRLRDAPQPATPVIYRHCLAALRVLRPELSRTT